MPRTEFPLTPASSTDITGQDGTKQLQQLQTAFELPPAAMNTASQLDTPVSPESQASPRAPYPIQPSEAVKSRRRAAAAATTTTTTTTDKDEDSFALPPPPTRPRKIIEMKPGAQNEKKSAGRPPAAAGGRGPGRKRQQQQPPSSSAAATGVAATGRKVARRTAHSLIERRRRCRMNEEFSVLRDMVPACTGEMHKLAILQVS
jgi:hypothetical protein